MRDPTAKKVVRSAHPSGPREQTTMATRGYRTIRSNGREVGPIGHELLRGNRGQEVQAVGSESNGADLMRGLNVALATANGREVMAVRS